jgi:hypothetical protein
MTISRRHAMSFVSWILVAVCIYLFYSVIQTKYNTTKRDEIKYDDVVVKIPRHLLASEGSQSDDLTFEEFQDLTDNFAKGKGARVAYKTVQWDAIQSWEYKVITHGSFNHTVWLEIITANETIRAQVMQRLKMKRYFKKYAPGKQLTNASNTIELIGRILSFGLIALIVYKILF